MKAFCFHEHGVRSDAPRRCARSTGRPRRSSSESEGLCDQSSRHLGRRGWPGLKLRMPHWGGSDIAGTVLEPGPGVAGWEPGDTRSSTPESTRWKTNSPEGGRHAQSRLPVTRRAPPRRIRRNRRRPGAEPRCVARRDRFSHGRRPLLVTVTAWRMLIHRARLKAGESVLVVGAGGGVNSMATQIAKLAGATVYVVAADARKAAMAEELGADFVVDRSRTDWGAEISGSRESAAST